MIEDKLTHDERLRLECLAQSIASHASRLGKPASDSDIRRTAEVFERFVKDGQRSTASNT